MGDPNKLLGGRGYGVGKIGHIGTSQGGDVYLALESIRLIVIEWNRESKLQFGEYPHTIRHSKLREEGQIFL